MSEVRISKEKGMWIVKPSKKKRKNGEKAI